MHIREHVFCESYMLGSLIINYAFAPDRVKHCKNRFSAEKQFARRTCTCIFLELYIFSSVLFRILIARETTLASRKNYIKDLMAWHARLRAEEDRVTRMEQAAFKLVATYSNVLNQQGNMQKQFYIKASVLKKNSILR